MEIPTHFGRKQMSRNFSESAFSQGGTTRKNLDQEEARKGMESMTSMEGKIVLVHAICMLRIKVVFLCYHMSNPLPQSRD